MILVVYLLEKNVGKSLVLKHLEDKYPENVFVLNLRTNPNILKCLMQRIQDRSKVMENPQIRSKLKSVIYDRIEPDGDGELFDVLDGLVQGLNTDKDVVTLITDEANIAFTITPPKER